MKKLQLLGLTLILSFAFTSSASGAARSWDLDGAHSNIYFSVDHIFSKVNGHFNEFNTEINFDPANLAESRIFFEIKVDSIDTNITKRDKHLQSADFFDVGSFPSMTFESTKITDAGNGLYNIIGKLSVKGTTYDLTLPLTLAGIKEHPAKKGTDVAGFNGNVTIDRLTHKVGNGKFHKMGIVGKDVDVFVSLEVLSAK